LCFDPPTEVDSSSVAGNRAINGLSHYAGSKHGLMGLTKDGLAKAVARCGFIEVRF
jgi:NAD(P)-dependent dehydrogenase (short-subunit alcohol dehydrogenase family)